MGDDGVVSVTEGLKGNNTMTGLGLVDIGMTDRGALAVLEWVEVVCHDCLAVCLPHICGTSPLTRLARWLSALVCQYVAVS